MILNQILFSRLKIVINPDFVRDNPQIVRDSQIARGENPNLVDEFLKSDQLWRDLTVEVDTLRAEQKTVSKDIGNMKSEEKNSPTAEVKYQLETLTSKGACLSEKISNLSQKLEIAKNETNKIIRQISNIVQIDAPVGGEKDFKVIVTIGKPRDFKAEGIEIKDHVQIGSDLNLMDIERGAKVSGSRFYYLVNDGALLEFALVNFAIDIAQQHGFSPVITPSLVKPYAMEGTGFLGQAAENVYRIEQDDLYLVGTSEVPLAAMHMNEILNHKDLPIKYAGYSPCFRREAGSHGKDTRGIFRVHWFDKVEMFVFSNLEDANSIHQKLLEIEKEVLTKLEIPFRVIDVATGDLGSSAARKFDCEAWIPSANEYRELTSTSNCTEFQSRRLKIRTRINEKTSYVATLNGTLLAVTRTIVALLENHQQKDGSFYIPKALRPYLKNRDKITCSY
jgi:seryl-tRNA synthetase